MSTKANEGPAPLSCGVLDRSGVAEVQRALRRRQRYARSGYGETARRACLTVVDVRTAARHTLPAP
jgi:hypothetical protein